MKSRLQIALSVLVLVAPAALTLMMVRLFFNASLYDLVPRTSDEIIYWHEIQTFTHAGFNGGYYTYRELPAPAAAIHFGAHGPWFAVVIGLFARVTGWYFFSMPFFSLAFITAALAFYLWIVRPTIPQQVAVLCLIITFYPLLLFIPSTLKESFNHAIAIVMAGIFYVQYARRSPLSTRQLLLFGLVIVLASLNRPTWSFLIVPLLLVNSGLSLRRQLWRVAAALGIVLLSFFVYDYTRAPYPNNFLNTVRSQLPQSRTFGLSLVVKHFLGNFRGFVVGSPLELLMRWQVLALTLLGFTGTFAFKGLRSRLNQKLGAASSAEMQFHLLNLGSILLIVFLLYDVYDYRDYRLFAPHLLASLLLLIARNHLKLAVLAIVSSAAFLGCFAGLYTAKLQFSPDYASMVAVQEGTRGVVVYNAQTSNPWCNTFLSITGFKPSLIALPPGIGISVGGLNEPGIRKSRYLLLNDRSYNSLSTRMQLRHIASFSNEELYLNESIDCD